MKKLYFAPILMFAFIAPAFAQHSPFLGRWDLTVQPQTGNPYPQWLEVVEKDGKLAGRFQPRGGAWKPFVDTKTDGNHMVIALNEATTRGPATIWDLNFSGDKLSGTEKQGEKIGPQISGVRAPELKRPMPKQWAAAKPLFDGKDLTGWEPIGTAPNKWIARDGELVNDNPVVEGQHNSGAANLKTTGKYQDFKLHIEVNCPEGGNSGIYLRGRYEIQIGTEGGSKPTHEMGAVYSHYAPGGNIGNKLGQWTAFDITFVGRYVTVVRYGV